MSGVLFVVAAPSGAGKTSLVNAVLKNLAGKYPLEQLITYTSRQPRLGEINGKDYFFITPQEFQEKIEQGFFLEWSSAYGTYYGSPKSILGGLVEGTSYIVILDRHGARAVAHMVAHAVLIWITVSSLEVLKSRLVTRNRDTQEQISRRMALAAQEIEQERTEKLFKYTILNDNFQDSVKTFNNIIVAYLSARVTI